MAVQHIRLTTDQEEALLLWLDEQIREAEERIDLRIPKWRAWREQYEARSQPKNFPWPNASNVYVPLTGIIVDAIHANMMNRLFGFERVWDVETMSPSTVVGQNIEDGQPITIGDLTKEVEDYLAFESSQTGMMDLYDAIEQALLEGIKLGSSVVFNPWITLTKKDIAYNADTGEFSRKSPTVVYDGLRPKLIPLEDFLFTPGYAEFHGPNAAPMVGHKYWLRWGQIQEKIDAGQFRPAITKDIKPFSGYSEGDDELKDAQEQTEGGAGGGTHAEWRKNDYQLYDLWITYDINDDGFEESLYVTYHKKSRKLLRIQPFIYKTRPYTMFRYVRRENRAYGMGVPEMLESIQAGVNTSFNQSVDNATIANVRCFKVKRNSFTARTLGDIYPGKRIFVDNMDDVEEFQLGEVYSSIFQVGLLLRDFAERRTGITDFNLGRESEVLGRGSTATTTMALLQEGQRRFDLYSKDVRRAIGELGMQTLELIQQMKPTGRIYRVKGDKGEMVERMLIIPAEASIREHLIVKATSAASASNKETARQNALTSFGLLVQYLERTFQMAGVMANPSVPPPLQKVAYDMSQVAERLMQQILESFEMPDVAALLPQLEGLLAAGQNQPLPFAGGPPGAQPPQGPDGNAGPMGPAQAVPPQPDQRGNPFLAGGGPAGQPGGGDPFGG